VRFCQRLDGTIGPGTADAEAAEVLANGADAGSVSKVEGTCAMACHADKPKHAQRTFAVSAKVLNWTGMDGTQSVIGSGLNQLELQKLNKARVGVSIGGQFVGQERGVNAGNVGRHIVELRELYEQQTQNQGQQRQS